MNDQSWGMMLNRVIKSDIGNWLVIYGHDNEQDSLKVFIPYLLQYPGIILKKPL